MLRGPYFLRRNCFLRAKNGRFARQEWYALIGGGSVAPVFTHFLPLENQERGYRVRVVAGAGCTGALWPVFLRTNCFLRVKNGRFA